jgi:hypothetical protein
MVGRHQWRDPLRRIGGIWVGCHRCLVGVGGEDYGKQAQALEGRMDIVVATRALLEGQSLLPLGVWKQSSGGDARPAAGALEEAPRVSVGGVPMTVF